MNPFFMAGAIVAALCFGIMLGAIAEHLAAERADRRGVRR